MSEKSLMEGLFEKLENDKASYKEFLNAGVGVSGYSANNDYRGGIFYETVDIKAYGINSNKVYIKRLNIHISPNSIQMAINKSQTNEYILSKEYKLQFLKKYGEWVVIKT